MTRNMHKASLEEFTEWCAVCAPPRDTKSVFTEIVNTLRLYGLELRTDESIDIMYIDAFDGRDWGEETFWFQNPAFVWAELEQQFYLHLLRDHRISQAS